MIVFVASCGIFLAACLAAVLIWVVDADIRRQERIIQARLADMAPLRAVVTIPPHRHKVKPRVMSHPNDPY